MKRSGGRPVSGILRAHLPRRFADRLLRVAGLAAGRRVAELSREEREHLLRALTACPLPVDGDAGWGKAEVTAGGIPLSEVRIRDLESRVAPGLFLAGEILDVTGRLGGFNFLWAWVTGRKAGRGAAA